MIENRLPIEDCLKAMRAEKAKRVNVYRKWVAEGKMTPEREARGLLEIDSVVDFLEAIEAIDQASKKLCALAGIQVKGNQ